MHKMRTPDRIVQNHFVWNRFFRPLFLAGVLAVLVGGCAGTDEASQSATATQEEQTWISLFDGTSLEGWSQAGPGRFALQDDGSIKSKGGMGLFYYSERPFRDFVLELEYKTSSDSANSGVFLRFPKRSDDPSYAVNNGYEIQINDSSDPIHQTGAIYDISAPFKLASKPPGQWNAYRIKVTGQRYQVFLNGEKVNDFFGDRGREGFIGVQNHDPGSTVWYRNIRVKPLSAGDYPKSMADLVSVDEERDPIRVLMMTATQGYRHGPAIKQAKTLVNELETTTEFTFDVTEDLSDLNKENLSRYDLLFLNNSTLRSQASAESDSASTSDDESWRSYELTLDTPEEGSMDGQLALYGDPGNLTGTIQFDQQPAPGTLEDVALSDSELTFHFTIDQYGQITGAAMLKEDTLEGTLTLTDQGGQTLPLSGARMKQDQDSKRKQTAERVTAEQQAAIRDFVRDGNGIVAAHAALDAFYEWDAYRKMMGGGLFEKHPWTQSVRGRVEQPNNSAMSHLGEDFWLRDEIYVLDENPRWNSRVLSSLSMSSVGIEQGHTDATRDDYPISWMRNYGDGHVFVTKLGHFPDVWTTPFFVKHVLQGLRMAADRVSADFTGRRVKEVISPDVWPDDIAVDKKGNVWIAELRGKVHRYDAAADTTRRIAKLSTVNPTKIEHGLLGIEVDPNFYDGSPYVYLYYTEPETFINTLSRFRYRDGQIDLSSEEVLLRVPTEPQCCHQAGDLEWGPDSTLYLSTGDTGMSKTRPSWELTDEEIQAFTNEHNLTDYHWSRLVDSERSAQNLQDLRGKILRINKDGTIPKDNPFYGKPGVRWEIYAYGLRNPYRFKVDPETGAVHVGVVGPDAGYDYDEYNVSTKGGENFGWPRSMGKLFYNQMGPEDIPSFEPPTWQYTYETGGRSATVGPIYRYEGKGGFPSAFQDKLFVFDWARRWIKWTDVSNRTFASDTSASVKRTPELVEKPAERYADIKTFDQLTKTTPISMEVGPDGALYVAEFAGFWGPAPSARVTRYRWDRGFDPVASASAAPVPEQNGRTFQFDAASSHDPDAGALTYEWSFGDGTSSSAVQPEHTYPDAGTYTARLIVTDPSGRTSAPVEVKVVAGDNPRVASFDSRK